MIYSVFPQTFMTSLLWGQTTNFTADGKPQYIASLNFSDI